MREDLPNPLDDPRTVLTGLIRQFFLSALEQQAAMDAGLSMTQRSRSGRLYKRDGDYLKIHLRSPAPDHVFDEDHSLDGFTPPTAEEPHIWVLLPLPHTLGNEPEDLDMCVLSATEFMVHVRYPDRLPASFTVRDNYLGNLLHEGEITPEDVNKPDASEDEQMEAARGWCDLVGIYDLRTIGDQTNGGQSAA